MNLPFEVGALYNRKAQIHALLGGQEQGGISTPKGQNIIIAFTGEPGVPHLYPDRRDDEGIFHYFGEGQRGDMQYRSGNLAIKDHIDTGKKLVVFQGMGKGRPCRYLGEFVALSSYIQDNTPDIEGNLRKAIVFRLKPATSNGDFGLSEEDATIARTIAESDVSETVKRTLVEVRTKQRLFRDRLIGVEKGCRLTKIEDLRFLRASHIKPWAESTAEERVDGENGLLLAPHADQLFDGGWISFDEEGGLLVASNMPPKVKELLRIELHRGRLYGRFSEGQQSYLDFHRNVVFEKSLKHI